MVVTVILGGLLVWSMTQKVEKPLEVPYDDKMDDEWDDTPLKRDPEAAAIIEYIGKKVEELVSWRREMDNIFLSDDNPARSLADLERNAPKWFQAFQELEKFAVNLSDEFKKLIVSLNNLGEQEFVSSHSEIFGVPQEVLARLA